METKEKPEDLPPIEDHIWNSYRKEMDEPQPVWGFEEEPERPSYKEWKHNLFNF